MGCKQAKSKETIVKKLPPETELTKNDKKMKKKKHDDQKALDSARASK